MGLWKSLTGIVRIEITSADPAKVLREINAAGIALLDVIHVDDLTLQGSVYRRDFHVVSQLLSRRGEKLEIIRKHGIYWAVKALKHRPILLGWISVVLFLALFLPTRVYFVKVEGNSSIPTQLILEKAQTCGITFGASRRAVRSEKMKNALISAIPELQWAGINTSGCVATISVREKSVTNEETIETKGVCSIVASRDGIIDSCTVLRGNVLCRVGQAVTAGQTLVSGYTDCGITIQATRADAEIMARTLRELEVVTPTTGVTRGKIIGEETKLSLRIGKKLINFYNDSGISCTTCVKMYEEDCLTLPGGFQLPIALIKEHYVYYEASTTQASEAELLWMEDAAKSYLQSQMVAGQIVNADTIFDMYDDVCCLRGQYACLEMIGQVKSEEIIGSNGEND